MIKKNKQIKIALLMILLSGVGMESVWSQGSITVQHQDGAFYSDRLPNGMQKTNTHRTTVYIKEGETKTLSLPTTGGSAPHSYSRWYDYDDDGVGNSPFTVDYNYQNGIVNYNGVKNTASFRGPAGFEKKAVAVDVAAYTDWNESNSYVRTEPTLSYRWIFDMVDANVMAEKLTAITNTGGYLEDKIVYLPNKAIGQKENPRVTLEYDRANYYVKIGDKSFRNEEKPNMVTYSEETTDDTYAYRDQYTYKSNSALYFAQSGASTFTGRFLYIDQTQKPKEITVHLECKVTIRKQRRYLQASYWENTESSTTTHRYNVARFKLNYVDLPLNYDELESQDATLTDDKKRSLKHLDENYVLINKLDFDYNTDPTTKENNAWLTPLQWDYCSYGFASAWLYLKGERKMPDGCAPSQNEYGFVKSANVSGISSGTLDVTITNPKDNNKVSGKYKYNWWNSGKIVYDRLHYQTKGKKDGYFMYIDASDTPGVVAKLPLENKLCAGTKLFVSAGVCSMTQETSTSYADINLIFKGVDTNGKETELNRYTTGDIPLVNSSNEKNPWHQVFYTFDYESEVEYDYYLLQIENNATSTKGGDYAIDDIRVYRSKPTVQANQILLPCGTEESAKIKIQIGYDKLISALRASRTNGTEEIEVKYQFMDADKKAITGYNYRQGASDGIANYNHGSIWIKTSKEEMAPWKPGEDINLSFDDLPTANGDKVFARIEHIENDPQGQYDYIVFRTPNNDVLKYNKVYHTTVSNSAGEFETGICSLISDPFIIEKPGQITVDGAAVIDGKGVCYGSPILMQAVLLDRINHEPIHPCSFDWYFGSGYAEISEELARYRADDAYPSGVDDTETNLQQPKGAFTQADYDILKEAIDTHKLYLNRKKIERRVMKGEIVLAKPIEGSTGKIDDPDFNICNDVIELDTSGESAIPEVETGQGIGSKEIRMSMEQLEELKNNPTKTLWIPVKSFKNSNQNSEYKIVQSEDNLYEDENAGIVYLCGTNDLDYAALDLSEALLPRIARLKTIEVGPDVDEQYLVFSFNREDDGFGITQNGFPMQEGRTYSLLFFFNEENNSGGSIAYAVCNGMCRININVVPKYLTWTGNGGDNWNNNGNWRRSTKEELYKEEADQYQETNGNNTLHFVPMHSSLVTIANTQTAPWLYKAEKRGDGSQHISANTNHPTIGTDSTDYKANAPTKEIEYTLEVWNGADEEVPAISQAKQHTYAGILFKGNHCKEIYFKQGAEMRNTQHLTYDKAHVEFELTNNRWYMLSSPLQNVVAGDMYIPTIGGRQVTEAFENIRYVQGTINNRFDPAVYQRSWSKDNAEVWQKEEGSYKVDRAGDWSDAFNTVDINYSVGTGFSIRPIYFEEANGSKEIKENHQTLFRLPKEDTSYSYYEYGGDVPDRDITISREHNGRLSTDLDPEGDVVANLEVNTGDRNVFLAGNPFMATLDMTKFFEENNKNLEENNKLKEEYTLLTEKGQCTFTKNNNGQWESSIEGLTGGTVAPMQGFFLIKANAGGYLNVTYQTNMTIAKPEQSTLLRSTQTRSEDDGIARLYATAERDGFQSHILIARQPGADNGYDKEEDAATIIDSNLKEYPTLYSVADSIVATINFVSDQKMIPLGIYSENEKEVTLTFSGMESFDQAIALYDTRTKTNRPINSYNHSFTIPGNTHGRYFIRLGEEEIAAAEGISVYTPGSYRIVVQSASPNDLLQQIEVYNTVGMKIQHLNQLYSLKEEIVLPAGIYLVKAESRNRVMTAKVIIKEE